MTPTDTPEYRRLALDSSNDMMRYDALTMYGDRTAARRHILDAARARVRMGGIKAAAGAFTHAAEDWLSAAWCFHLAGDRAATAECVARVRELADAGRIPAERRDLWADLADREAELRALPAAPAAAAPAAGDPLPAPQP